MHATLKAHSAFSYRDTSKEAKDSTWEIEREERGWGNEVAPKWEKTIVTENVRREGIVEKLEEAIFNIFIRGETVASWIC